MPNFYYYPTGMPLPGQTHVVSIFAPKTKHFYFTPSYFNEIHLSITAPSVFATTTIVIDSIVKDSISFTPELVITKVCDEGVYAYGYNGKLKDDEWAGKGNHLDYGARGYDSRGARWISVDPLSAVYPFASPYVYALNTPIRAYDPDGRIVIFADKVSEEAYNKVYSLAGKDYRAKLDNLVSSKVEYYVNANTTVMTSGSTDPNLIGETAFDFKNNRVMVEVSSKLTEFNSKVTTIGDELIGASQYDEGKFGFKLNNDGTQTTLGYDMQDEIETKNGELEIAEGLIKENSGLELGADLSQYKSYKDNGKSEKYFKNSEFGKKYQFSPLAPAYGNLSLATWYRAYKNGKIKGVAFKANIDNTQKDEGGNVKLTPGGRNQIVLPPKE